MSDPSTANVIPPVSLHPEDAANAAALIEAGIERASQLGSFQPPQPEELAARIERLEKMLSYIAGMYFREIAVKFPEL